MIARSKIANSLKLLDRLFQKSRSQRQTLLYSKVAILELCGWIEEEMDDFVIRCCNRNVTDEKLRKHFANQIVNRNYGFEYDTHFRKMLINVIGLKNFQKMEAKADAPKLQKFRSVLSRLKPNRDSFAHTHIKRTAIQISAPSQSARDFLDADAGFQELNRVLKKLNL
jgi:pyruvate formate-lyase activating enzyme-like uncharacterized protein